MRNKQILSYKKEKRQWKYCTSLSCIITGTVLTLALHKQGGFMSLICSIIIALGVIFHIRIMKKNLNTSLKNFIVFLANFSMLLMAMLFTSLLQIIEGRPILIFSLDVLTVLLSVFSIRYFLNLIYHLILYLKSSLRKKEQDEKKIDYTMWIISFFSAIATIFSLFVSIGGILSSLN